MAKSRAYCKARMMYRKGIMMTRMIALMTNSMQISTRLRKCGLIDNPRANLTSRRAANPPALTASK